MIEFVRSIEGRWLYAGLAALVALLAALVIHRLALAIARRLSRSSPVLNTLTSFAARPTQLALPLLALQTVWQSVPDDLFLIGAVRHLTTLALIGALTWLALRCVAAAVEATALLSPVDTADNLHARRIQTQFRVLANSLHFLIVLIGAAAALMTFPGVHQIGVSLLASAGVAGLVIGFAAKPVLGNLLAGLQIALTQPIRLDDVVIVQGEWGRVEEITGAFVVVQVWDERRLVVPLQWFIENPFQNWTRTSSKIIGSVFLWLDYRMPLAPLRSEAERICAHAPEWDRRICATQVTDTSERSMQVRVLVSAADSSLCWDLRCRMREELISFIQREYPQHLPQLRIETGTHAFAAGESKNG